MLFAAAKGVVPLSYSLPLCRPHSVRLCLLALAHACMGFEVQCRVYMPAEAVLYNV